jgi:hypothetical protein
VALVVQFKSAIKPGLVFAAIPYGITGAVACLWPMGAPFGFHGVPWRSLPSWRHCEPPVSQLIRILSASIAPVIVISGVGLVLLSMTNRYSHVIDRALELIKKLNAQDDQHRKLLADQVKIIYHRARVLRIP